MKQPSRDILTAYQRSGVSWQAVDRDAVREAVDIVIQSGAAFSERLALMDLHYWIDRQSVRPFRYYAARWQWGEKKTRRLFESLGLLGHGRGTTGAQEGHKQGTENDEIEPESGGRGTIGAQEGHGRGTRGAQYTTSSSLSPSGEKESQDTEASDTRTSPRSRRSKGRERRAGKEDDRLAQLLYDRILENDPHAKRPNLATWAEDINRCHRLDGRNYTDIEAMIEWCQADTFWSGNILSASKFRTQFPKLKLQSERKRGNSNGAYTTPHERSRQAPANGQPASYGAVAEQIAAELERKRRQRGFTVADALPAADEGLRDDEGNRGGIFPLAVDRNPAGD